MRVLAMATSYPKAPDDSTAPFVRSISQGLHAHGVEVHLLIPHHPDLAWNADDPPVRLYSYPYLPARWRGLHVWGYAGALQSDLELRRRTLAVLPAAAASALYHFLRLAKLIRPQVLHAHWLLPNGPLAALVSKRTGVPLVVSLHGSGAFMAERHATLRGAARFCLRQAAAVTACSRDLASRAEALGASTRTTHVIPYGVELRSFRPPEETERNEARASLGIDPDTFLVVAVGRLVAKKGFDVLIRAMPALFRAHPSARFLIAGKGDLELKLRRLADAVGASASVTFLGDVDRKRLLAIHAAADVLAVPSIHDSKGNVDGLPNVILEGLASGLPLVASGIAGIPDVIRHEDNGLLVPEQDPEALASALSRLASEPELRRRLGQAARRSAEDDLDWHSITGCYAEVLRKVAGEMSTASIAVDPSPSAPEGDSDRAKGAGR